MGKQRCRGAIRTTMLWVVLAGVAAGCSAFRVANQPLAHYDPAYGYRPKNSEIDRPAGDVILMLAFSGGGSRAAALSYGVLQELRDTIVTVHGKQERLLDDVDVITSVSGGSFTAAYYGLFGDRIFTDYETVFLRRNIQRELIWEILNPLNWFLLAREFFDRSELAVRLYDEEIFQGATFADLQAKGGPFVQINATDLAAANRFTFFQPQFDLICSDLSQLEVARAVAASSAVPGVFSAITLRNYAGTCDFVRPPFLDEALAGRKESLRRYRNARVIERYLERKPKYIHLVDGGVADNLGLRGPLDNIILVGGLRERLDQLGANPRILGVVVVNAEVHPEPEFSDTAIAPSLGAVIDAVSNTQIYSYNFETLELMRDSTERWAHDLSHDGRGQTTEAFVVEIAFESLSNEKEREYFDGLPTSFTLSDEAVDRLIDAGRRLLRESPDYQRMLAALGGAAPAGDTK
jgi:NTE family protein